MHPLQAKSTNRKKKITELCKFIVFFEITKPYEDSTKREKSGEDVSKEKMPSGYFGENRNSQKGCYVETMALQEGHVDSHGILDSQGIVYGRQHHGVHHGNPGNVGSVHE